MTAYDIARICLNGHLVDFDFVFPGRPGLNQSGDPFCERCGEPAIAVCPSCKCEIRRRQNVSWMAADAVPASRIPSFCRNCGKPYPWTESKLNAARELIYLSDLDAADKKTLSNDLPDLAQDSPRTSVAATRFKKLAARLGGGVASAVRDIVVDVASEAAKKIMFGP